VRARGGCRHRVRVGRGKSIGKKPCYRPFVGRDQRQQRLLQTVLEGGCLFPQSQQELARGVGVIERAVRSRLRKTQLDREQRQAVARRSRKKDAGNVEGVEDLLGRVPEAGRGQEVDIEAGAVPDRLPPTYEIGELAQRGVGARRAAKLLLPDPGQSKDRLGHRAPGVDQPLHGAVDAIGREGDRADLDHTVPRRIETGRLEIESCVFRHYRPRFYVRPEERVGGAASHRLHSSKGRTGAPVAIFARDADRSHRGTQAT